MSGVVEIQPVAVRSNTSKALIVPIRSVALRYLIGRMGKGIV